MKTLTFPRRAMRPPPPDELPRECKWCGRPIGRGEVFTVGHDLGKFVAVCGACLPPPPIGSRQLEIVLED